MLKKVLLIVVLSLFFISCKREKKDEFVKEIIYPVKLAVSKKIDIDKYIKTNATIKPYLEVELFSKVIGTVKKVYFKEGDYIKTGEIVYEIENKELTNSLLNAKIKYDQAVTNYNYYINDIKTDEIEILKLKVKIAKINRDELKKRLKNAKKLLKDNLTSQDEYDDIFLKYRNSEIEYKIAKKSLNLKLNEKNRDYINLLKLKIKEAKTSYELLKIQNDYLKVRAPISGIFINKNKDIGQQIFLQNSLGKIAKLNRLKVEPYISEKDIIYIKKGQKAIISYNNREITGKIINISPIFDEVTRSIKITILIENSDFLIKPGNFCDIKIKVFTKKNVPTVKKDAIIIKDGEKYLFIYDNEKIVEKMVKTGLEKEDNIEILDDVLKKDTLYIVEGQHLIKTTSKIDILNRNSKEIKQMLSEYSDKNSAEKIRKEFKKVIKEWGKKLAK